MRDGVHLNATMYMPVGMTRPAPCIVSMTPYVSDTYHDRGVLFAAAGLPFMVVDVRGRGNSEGAFRPRVHEARDGHDVVEWLAAQPCCDGKVGMWGGSYAGYAQWATAKESPRCLGTIVPVAAPFSGVDSPMRNNIFFPERMQWLAFTAGRTAQTRIYSDAAFWASLLGRWHQSGRSFREVDRAVGMPSPILQEWLDHPEPDPYWDAQNPTQHEYSRLYIPILTITGAYDDNQPGALEHYRRYMAGATAAGRSRHYLVIGPWDHAGTRTPALEFGGLRVGGASLLDLQHLHVEWYLWTLANGPKPAFFKKPVAYYVMQADEWRYADDLDGVTSRLERFFLDSAGCASDVFSSGTLKEMPGSGYPDTYRYDPREVDRPEVEAEGRSHGRFIIDQSVTLAMSGRQFVYHSEPFRADVEVTGFFRLAAWIAIDCPDTDFYVSVHEVCLDGTCIRLSTDALRARYREGLRAPRLIRTEDPLLYEFNRFTFVSRLVKGGHRLRVVIAPMGKLNDTPYVQKNYNSGGIVSEESAADARPVTARLFHDPEHQSVLFVPIGRSPKGM